VITENTSLSTSYESSSLLMAVANGSGDLALPFAQEIFLMHVYIEVREDYAGSGSLIDSIGPGMQLEIKRALNACAEENKYAVNLHFTSGEIIGSFSRDDKRTRIVARLLNAGKQVRAEVKGIGLCGSKKKIGINVMLYD